MLILEKIKEMNILKKITLLIRLDNLIFEYVVGKYKKWKDEIKDMKEYEKRFF